MDSKSFLTPHKHTSIWKTSVVQKVMCFRERQKFFYAKIYTNIYESNQAQHQLKITISFQKKLLQSIWFVLYIQARLTPQTAQTKI